MNITPEQRTMLTKFLFQIVLFGLGQLAKRTDNNIDDDIILEVKKFF